ncbi:MAG: glycoside hydrolase family 3 N-terminal domain-containing protein [bacterium]
MRKLPPNKPNVSEEIISTACIKSGFPLPMPSQNPGQLLLVGVPGAELDSDSARLFRQLQPGGFILFGRNIKSPQQLRKLVDDLRDLSSVEPIITIDQEGGSVSRLKRIGNEPPSAQQLRHSGNLDLIRRHGDITGRILRLFGFNLDLCPVLDISFDDEADNSLRGRCYGRDVAEVIEKSTAFNDALRATGVLSCGKHFPGYASAGLDPHHELPRIERSKELMEEHELAVFRHFAQAVDSMMIGHIAVSGLEDANRPASLSPVIIRDLLRKEMGFSGLVMTDDLDMGAILNHYGFDETMRLGIEAGNDMLMICHRIEMAAAAKKALDTMGKRLDESLEAMARFKTRLAPPTPFSLEAFQAVDAEIYDLRVAVLGPELAAQRSPEGE